MYKDMLHRFDNDFLLFYQKEFIKYLKTIAVKNQFPQKDLSKDFFKNGVESYITRYIDDVNIAIDKKTFNQVISNKLHQNLKETLINEGYISKHEWNIRKNELKGDMIHNIIDKVNERLRKEQTKKRKIVGFAPSTVREYFARVGAGHVQAGNSEMKRFIPLKLPEYEKKPGTKNKIFNATLHWNWFVAKEKRKREGTIFRQQTREDAQLLRDTDQKEHESESESTDRNSNFQMLLKDYQETRGVLPKKGGRKKKKTKSIRKHKGINQKTGKLKKGYKYGKKLKNGLQIIKIKKLSK